VPDAVVDAVQEALTNIAKHAKVNTAVMWATATSAGLTVSVLNHGIGFDPQRVHRWIGLAKSIAGRVREIGGHVRIDSAPGAGTYIELTVPGAAWDGNGRSAAACEETSNSHKV
jgi:signal transduction histidine kinase